MLTPSQDRSESSSGRRRHVGAARDARRAFVRPPHDGLQVDEARIASPEQVAQSKKCRLAENREPPRQHAIAGERDAKVSLGSIVGHRRRFPQKAKVFSFA